MLNLINSITSDSTTTATSVATMTGLELLEQIEVLETAGRTYDDIPLTAEVSLETHVHDGYPGIVYDITRDISGIYDVHCLCINPKWCQEWNFRKEEVLMVNKKTKGDKTPNLMKMAYLYVNVQDMSSRIEHRHQMCKVDESMLSHRMEEAGLLSQAMIVSPILVDTVEGKTVLVGTEWGRIGMDIAERRYERPDWATCVKMTVLVLHKIESDHGIESVKPTAVGVMYLPAECIDTLYSSLPFDIRQMEMGKRQGFLKRSALTVKQWFKGRRDIRIHVCEEYVRNGYVVGDGCSFMNQDFFMKKLVGKVPPSLSFKIAAWFAKGMVVLVPDELWLRFVGKYCAVRGIDPVECDWIGDTSSFKMWDVGLHIHSTMEKEIGVHKYSSDVLSQEEMVLGLQFIKMVRELYTPFYNIVGKELDSIKSLSNRIKDNDIDTVKKVIDGTKSVNIAKDEEDYREFYLEKMKENKEDIATTANILVDAGWPITHSAIRERIIEGVKAKMKLAMSAPVDCTWAYIIPTDIFGEVPKIDGMEVVHIPGGKNREKFIINRAPGTSAECSQEVINMTKEWWHKHGYLWIDDHTIAVSSKTAKKMSGDFDGDCIKAIKRSLLELFGMPKNRVPSYIGDDITNYRKGGGDGDRALSVIVANITKELLGKQEVEARNKHNLDLVESIFNPIKEKDRIVNHFNDCEIPTNRILKAGKGPDGFNMPEIESAYNCDMELPKTTTIGLQLIFNKATYDDNWTFVKNLRKARLHYKGQPIDGEIAAWRLKPAINKITRQAVDIGRNMFTLYEHHDMFTKSQNIHIEDRVMQVVINAAKCMQKEMSRYPSGYSLEGDSFRRFRELFVAGIIELTGVQMFKFAKNNLSLEYVGDCDLSVLKDVLVQLMIGILQKKNNSVWPITLAKLVSVDFAISVAKEVVSILDFNPEGQGVNISLEGLFAKGDNAKVCSICGCDDTSSNGLCSICYQSTCNSSDSNNVEVINEESVVSVPAPIAKTADELIQSAVDMLQEVPVLNRKSKAPCCKKFKKGNMREASLEYVINYLQNKGVDDDRVGYVIDKWHNLMSIRGYCNECTKKLAKELVDDAMWQIKNRELINA
jgi:hypothetical protein